MSVPPTEGSLRNLLPSLNDRTAATREQGASEVKTLSLLMVGALLGALISGTGPADAEDKKGDPPMTSAQEITTPSGLKYVDLQVGSGDLAVTGSLVTVHYTGWLIDGTKFDSSV